MVTPMPRNSIPDKTSPRVIQPISAAIGGTRAIINIEILAPIIINALKRKRSPSTKL